MLVAYGYNSLSYEAAIVAINKSVELYFRRGKTRSCSRYHAYL